MRKGGGSGFQVSHFAFRLSIRVYLSYYAISATKGVGVGIAGAVRGGGRGEVRLRFAIQHVGGCADGAVHASQRCLPRVACVKCLD